MRIARNLNLVVPVETETGKCWVHSTPISREIFETYFFVIAKTFASIFGQGLGSVSGPRVAYLMLKKTAEDLNTWNGADGVKNGLINEIKRLTNVAIPTKDNGWETVPYATAESRKLIDDDTLAEVEGQLVFFILVSAMNRREQAKPILEVATELWGSQLTALDSTAFAHSLTTSTAPGNSGATAIT